MDLYCFVLGECLKIIIRNLPGLSDPLYIIRPVTNTLKQKKLLSEIFKLILIYKRINYRS